MKGNSYMSNQYTLNIDGNQCTSEKSVKLEGNNIDNNLSFDEHLSSLCPKTSNQLKVGLLPSKRNCFIWLDESLLKLMKNAFYSILKALFVLKIFEFLSWPFGHIEKTTWLER